MSYLRSIMLAVRGSYQAGMAMRMARTDIQKLVKAQREQVRATEQMIQKSHQILFAGAAFTVFGGLVTKGLFKVMEASQEGRKALFNFSRSSTQSLQRISRALAPMMEWFLKATAGILEFVSTSPSIVKLAAGLLIIAGPLLMIGGIIVTLVGSLRMLKFMWKLHNLEVQQAVTTTKTMTATLEALMPWETKTAAATQTLTASVKGLDMSAKSLAVTLGSVVSMFMIAYNVISALSNLVKGKGGLSEGLTLVGTALGAIGGFMVGGPAGALIGGSIGGTMGGMIGGAISPPSYASGTSFVKQGGLAVLHGGEEIKSAREGSFMSKIEKTTIQSAPSGPQKVGYYNVPITIENLHTKSDTEDLAIKMKRILKDALDNKV